MIIDRARLLRESALEAAMRIELSVSGDEDAAEDFRAALIVEYGGAIASGVARSSAEADEDHKLTTAIDCRREHAPMPFKHSATLSASDDAHASDALQKQPEAKTQTNALALGRPALFLSIWHTAMSIN
jgi:hypothetical protein